MGTTADPDWLLLVHPNLSEEALQDITTVLQRHHPDAVVVPEGGYLRFERPADPITRMLRSTA